MNANNKLVGIVYCVCQVGWAVPTRYCLLRLSAHAVLFTALVRWRYCLLLIFNVIIKLYFIKTAPIETIIFTLPDFTLR